MTYGGYCPIIILYYFQICTALLLFSAQRHSNDGARNSNVCFESRSSRLNQPFVSSAGDGHNVLFSSVSERKHAPAPSCFHQRHFNTSSQNNYGFHISYLNPTLWIIEESPSSVSPVLISQHSKVARHTFIHSFNFLLFFSFSFLRGNLLYTNTHKTILPWDVFELLFLFQIRSKCQSVRTQFVLCASLSTSSLIFSLFTPLSLFSSEAARLLWFWC